MRGFRHPSPEKKNNGSFQCEDIVTVLCDSVTLQKSIKKQTKVIIEIKKLEKIAPSKLGKLAGKIFEIWRHWFSFASGIEMAPILMILRIKK